MVKPSFNSSINEEGIEEREELEKEEDDVKQREEEKISEPDFMPETFSCPMTADPVPDQGSGTFGMCGRTEKSLFLYPSNQKSCFKPVLFTLSKSK